MVGGGKILQMQDTFTGGRGDTTAARDLQSKEGEDTTDARHLHWWEGGGGRRYYCCKRSSLVGGGKILLLQDIFTGGRGGGLLLRYN